MMVVLFVLKICLFLSITFVFAALGVDITIDVKKSYKPAEPKIIHCGECAFAEVADPEDVQDGYVCQFHPGSIWFSGSFCSWAKAKTEVSE